VDLRRDYIVLYVLAEQPRLKQADRASTPVRSREASSRRGIRQEIDFWGAARLFTSTVEHGASGGPDCR
jgi:hypothetical protein